ncbi:unnamed protein product [Prunus armeniaca]
MRAGWLTAGEAVPSGSGRIAAPRSSADKPRPQPWTGRSEGRARPGRSPRSPSDHSPFHRQESRRGRAPRTKGTAEQGTPGTATRSSQPSHRKIYNKKSRCYASWGPGQTHWPTARCR